MLMYLLIISLHNRSLQTFFFFLSYLIWLNCLLWSIFIFLLCLLFFFLSEEMSVFERLETNGTKFQSRSDIWLHSCAHKLVTFFFSSASIFAFVMIGPGTFCANYPEFLLVDPDLQQFQSRFQLCGEMLLVGANSSAVGLC